MAAGDKEEIQRSVGSHETIKTFLDESDNHMQAMVQVDENGETVHITRLVEQMVELVAITRSLAADIKLMNMRIEVMVNSGLDHTDTEHEF